jgi:hypothetical protein
MGEGGEMTRNKSQPILDNIISKIAHIPVFKNVTSV